MLNRGGSGPKAQAAARAGARARATAEACATKQEREQDPPKSGSRDRWPKNRNGLRALLGAGRVAPAPPTLFNMRMKEFPWTVLVHWVAGLTHATFHVSTFMLTSQDTVVTCILCEAPAPAKGKAKGPAKGLGKGPPDACRTLLSFEVSCAPVFLVRGSPVS